MDQFDLIPDGNQNGDYLAYTQLMENDIPNYLALARYFTLGDAMFSSLSGPSFPGSALSAEPSWCGLRES
jgi:hypothetical protein